MEEHMEDTLSVVRARVKEATSFLARAWILGENPKQYRWSPWSDVWSGVGRLKRSCSASQAHYAAVSGPNHREPPGGMVHGHNHTVPMTVLLASAVLYRQGGTAFRDYCLCLEDEKGQANLGDNTIDLLNSLVNRRPIISRVNTHAWSKAGQIGDCRLKEKSSHAGIYFDQYILIESTCSIW